MPSHTDLMVRSGSRCLAIEAKWTEPIYPSVSEWLQGKTKGSSLDEGIEDAFLDEESRETTNRDDVLAGWLGLLRPHANRDLIPKEFAACVYQMLHRAASACHRTKLSQLAYVKFAPSPDKRAGRPHEYKGGLESLHSLLGSPVDFPFFLIEIQIAPTKAFHSIKKLPKGHATGVSVRNALRDYRLFEFLSYRTNRIRSSGQ